MRVALVFALEESALVPRGHGLRALGGLLTGRYDDADAREQLFVS
ncbi:MAG: hypothetical protein ACYTGN_10310 [Planctomycetota bacterium]